MQPRDELTEHQRDLAAKRLDRLSGLAKRAHARGDHARYRQLKEAVRATLPLTGWRPPELSEEDQAAVRRGELFTDATGYMAQLVVLKDAGHVPNVAFGEDADSQQFVRDVRRLNRGWKVGRIARVPRRRVIRAPVIHLPTRRELRPRRRHVNRSARAHSPPRRSSTDDEELARHADRRSA
jgi:hypothetical protein